MVTSAGGSRDVRLAGDRDVAVAVDVIFYDGVCAMCSALVLFVLDRDRHDRFQFAPLQSSFAAGVLARHHRDAHDLDTLYVVVGLGSAGERILERSRAALHVCRALPFPWRLLAAARFLPTGFLDWCYDRVARSRYRIFGRYDTCRIPTAKDRTKFLGEGA